MRALPLKLRHCGWLIALLIVTLLPLETEAADAWLKLRRKGVSALLDAAVKAATPEPWRATWRIKADEKGALKGLSISVRMQRVEARKDQPAKLATVIMLAGPAALNGVGISTLGQQVWLRSAKGKGAVKAKAKALFTELPLLQIPLALLAATGLAHHYEGKLAGEFGGSAVIVLQPKYTATADWKRLKLGISKRRLVPTMAEYNDRNGRPLGRWLWLKTRMVGELMVADTLRIRTMKREAPVELQLASVERGVAIARLPVGVKALK